MFLHDAETRKSRSSFYSQEWDENFHYHYPSSACWDFCSELVMWVFYGERSMGLFMPPLPSSVIPVAVNYSFVNFRGFRAVFLLWYWYESDLYVHVDIWEFSEQKKKESEIPWCIFACDFVNCFFVNDRHRNSMWEFVVTCNICYFLIKFIIILSGAKLVILYIVMVFTLFKEQLLIFVLLFWKS